MNDERPEEEYRPNLFIGETKVRVELKELSIRSKDAVKGVVDELGFSIDEISSITVEMKNPHEQEGK